MAYRTNKQVSTRRKIMYSTVVGVATALSGCSGGSDGTELSWYDIFETDTETYKTQPADNGSYGFSFMTRNTHEEVTVARIVWELGLQTTDAEVFFEDTVEATEVEPGEENSWFFELSQDEAQQITTISQGAREIELAEE